MVGTLLNEYALPQSFNT